MKQIYSIFLGLCLLATPQAFADSKSFLTGFEDIPMIKGFKQLENNNFSFGNEETRYVETQISASGKKEFSDVRDFYIKTLTQLGWNELNSSGSSLSFYRENDILEITKVSQSPLKVNIILKNKN